MLLAAEPECLTLNSNYEWSKAENGVYFTITSGKGNWQDMAMECQKIQPGKSSIASIRSEAEQKTAFGGHYWIGGVRVGGTNWFWWRYTVMETTPVEMVYTNWHDGEPNNADNAEYCAESNEGKWNDVQCSNRIQALCEIRSMYSERVCE